MATSKQLAGPASRGDAGRGRAQLRREFRAKRHEKLTGPRFDVASKFRCTRDRSSRGPCRLPREEQRGGEGPTRHEAGQRSFFRISLLTIASPSPNFLRASLALSYLSLALPANLPRTFFSKFYRSRGVVPSTCANDELASVKVYLEDSSIWRNFRAEKTR